MEKHLNTVITGSGHYLPPRIIKNDYFLSSEFYNENGEKFPQPNEVIIQKFFDITGIYERRWVSPEQKSSDIAAYAAEEAIKDWGGDRESIDYIIAATNSGETEHGIWGIDTLPSLASRIKHKLGIQNIRCIPYDMTFGCPGWIEAVIMGHILIQARQAKNVLVTASDVLSRVSDPHDRDSMIFADGAGAIIISAVEDDQKYGILTHATLNFSGEELEYLIGGPSHNPDFPKEYHSIKMQGRKVYEFVLKNVPGAIKEVIDAAGLSLEDTKKLLIHQANEKMDEAVFVRLKRLYRNNTMTTEEYMPMTINWLGNSSVATVPTMFDMICREQLGDHRFHPGDNIVMTSVGAGMNINAFVYRFEPRKK